MALSAEAHDGHEGETPGTAPRDRNAGGLLALTALDVERIAHQVAELIATRLPGTGLSPRGWLDTRAAAVYAGCSVSSLHKAMASREVRFSQNGNGGKAWFRCEWIDAWREAGAP
jgi:hypothetical protein